VDADKSTITVDVKGEGEKTFTVAKDARIIIDGKPGKLAGLPTKDVTVLLTVSADGKTVRSLQAEGPYLYGVMKEAKKGTITITLKTEEDKTVAVAKKPAVQVDNKPGKLDAVPAGAHVTMRLTVDGKTARHIEAVRSYVVGTVKAVDA